MSKSPLHSGTRQVLNDDLPDVARATSGARLPADNHLDEHVLVRLPITSTSREGHFSADEAKIDHKQMGYATAREWLVDWLAGEINRPLILLIPTPQEAIEDIAQKRANQDSRYANMVRRRGNVRIPALRTIRPELVLEVWVEYGEEAPIHQKIIAREAEIRGQ